MNWEAIVSGLMCVVSFWFGWFVCHHFDKKEIVRRKIYTEMLEREHTELEEKHLKLIRVSDSILKNFMEIEAKTGGSIVNESVVDCVLNTLGDYGFLLEDDDA